MVNIIPHPNQVEIHNNEFKLSPSAHIYYNKECKNEAIVLQQLLREEHDLNLPMSQQNIDSSTGNIYLSLSLSDSGTFDKDGYTLKVDQSKIVMAGSSSAGIFYGIQSLRQIIKNGQGNNKIVPCLSITDNG